MLIRQAILCVACVVLLSSCATGYTSMQDSRTIGSVSKKTEELEVITSIQPFGENERFDDTAREERITILKLQLHNISDSELEVDGHSVLYSLNENGIGDLTMQADEVRDKMGLTVWWYALWAPLVLTIESNGSSGVALPIGLPIAVFNMLRASNTNSSFEAELEDGRLRKAVLEPGGKSSGWIYLPVRGRDCYLIVKYRTKDGETKELRMLYGV